MQQRKLLGSSWGCATLLKGVLTWRLQGPGVNLLTFMQQELLLYGANGARRHSRNSISCIRTRRNITVPPRILALSLCGL